MYKDELTQEVCYIFYIQHGAVRCLIAVHSRVRGTHSQIESNEIAVNDPRTWQNEMKSKRDSNKREYPTEQERSRRNKEEDRVTQK